VAVIQIHTVNAEPFQRLLARLAAVLGGRVCVEPRPVGVHRQSELGGEEYLLALAGVLLEPLACSKPLSDEDRSDTRGGKASEPTKEILVVAIHIRSVPKEQTILVQPVENLEALFV
jgi:hypothetical protein